MSRIVAIVGRPNVGKSTFFNRLTESRKAIVDNLSGVTRDRHYGKVEWIGQEFSVIDTGGYVHGSDDVFEAAIRDQVITAMEEADVILFMVDVTTGITDLDDKMANLLRKNKKPLLLICNKVDHNDRLAETHEFYKFGLGELWPISSQTGSGTGDLLDEIVRLLPPEPVKDENEEEVKLPRFTIIGRPNVGKSTFLNALTGAERSIVTPIAGTTRDTIDTHYNLFNKEFILVDTAGIRKKAKVHEDIEFYSVMRSIRAIESSDVCFMIIDASEGLQAQDLSILNLAEKNKKGLVILVNKWDLVEKDNSTMEDFKKRILERIAPFVDVPIIFMSALEKQRIFKAIEDGLEVYDNLKKQIKTHLLNDVMLKVIENYPPPATKGKYIRIKYVTQVKTKNPTFLFFCNLPQYIKEPYKRFIENKLRENFRFTGVPLTIFFREK